MNKLTIINELRQRPATTTVEAPTALCRAPPRRHH